jgi:hypothetical protein
MDKNKTPRSKRGKKRESTLDQGFVKKEDLNPSAEDQKLMTPEELDLSAEKAESSIRGKDDELQGEGNYEAAKSYTDAAEDFAGRKGGRKKQQ